MSGLVMSGAFGPSPPSPDCGFHGAGTFGFWVCSGIQDLYCDEVASGKPSSPFRRGALS